MPLQSTQISKKGRLVTVPSIEIDGVVVIADGIFPRLAAVKDEEFVEHTAWLTNPAGFIAKLKASGLSADIVTFAESINESSPRLAYPFYWDNVAAADTRSFDSWWEKLPQATRKNCRRAERRGVRVHAVPLDTTLARGIQTLYNEMPVRQGRRFWHFGKDVDTVLRDNSSYLDRSEFIAAYHGADLIGFLKLVRVGRVARIMQLLSSVAHYDKRPMNAIIAKAVEICCQQGMTHLVYSKFQYGNRTNTPLMEFKLRNGFHRLDFPRYNVALTVRGRAAVACRLHRELIDVLPSRVISLATSLRDAINSATGRSRQGALVMPSENESS
jgi:hypothetical protein